MGELPGISCPPQPVFQGLGESINVAASQPAGTVCKALFLQVRGWGRQCVLPLRNKVSGRWNEFRRAQVLCLSSQRGWDSDPPPLAPYSVTSLLRGLEPALKKNVLPVDCNLFNCSCSSLGYRAV